MACLLNYKSCTISLMCMFTYLEDSLEMLNICEKERINELFSIEKQTTMYEDTLQIDTKISTTSKHQQHTKRRE